MELWSILLLLLLSSSCWGLNIHLNVPSQADIRSPLTLRCEFDLEGESLYSVKWYKDEQEFFRYMPDYPMNRAFPVAGITVDLSRCDMHTVSLVNLNFNTSGNYRCEVSTEAPKFLTVADSANMSVMAFPVEDPVIEGILPTYSVGDFVSANCTSPRSKPPTTLKWYINNVRARTSEWEYPMNDDSVDARGLYIKMIGLQFQVSRSHFIGNVPTMEIRCSATLGHVTRQKTLSAALVILSNETSQELLPSSSVTTECWRLISVMLVCSSAVLLAS